MNWVTYIFLRWNTPPIDLKINSNLQNSTFFFAEIVVGSKIHMKLQGTQNSQKNLGETELEGSNFRFKTYNETWVINSGSKKNPVICSKTRGPRECHTEWVSKSDRGRNVSWHPLCAESKGSDTSELIYKTDSQRTNLGLQGEGWEERVNREFGMDRYTLLLK